MTHNMFHLVQNSAVGFFGEALDLLRSEQLCHRFSSNCPRVHCYLHHINF